MKIHVLRKMKYKGTYIYVNHYVNRTDFEYLFSWDDGIHRDFIQLKLNLIPRILVALRLKPLYTKDQYDSAEKVLLSGAMDVIDKLSGRAYMREQEREVKKRAKTRCQWQTTGQGDEAYYLCIVHGEAVKMEDGKTPAHV